MSVSSQKAVETLADTILQVVEDKLNKMNRDLVARISKLESAEAQNEVYIGVGQPNAEAKIWIDTTDLYPSTEDNEGAEGENNGDSTEGGTENGETPEDSAVTE